MADTERSGKATERTLMALSSSSYPSSFSSEEESSLESESESEDYDISCDDDAEEITSSTSCGDEEDDDCVYEENEGKDESMCSRVVKLLQGKSDLQELTLVECKAYLRKHGLRLSGTRAECILRIKERWRLNGGIGETLYPRSSFTIHCTGDVCRGDVVLFTQKVYKKFDKVTRSGSLLGKRTVAGRIVKESYGAAKQQHTFTVEVLWSKGIKKLPPLFPLLVKGRNLYRMKTYRQCWKNEKERSKILTEKHTRGAAARLIREMRRTKAVKRTQKISSTKEGSKKGFSPTCKGESGKRQKRVHQHSSSPQMSTAVKKDKRADKHGKTPVGNQKGNYYHQKVPAFGRSNLRGTRKLSPRSSHQQHQNLLHPYEGGESILQQYAYPQNYTLFQSKQYHKKAPYVFSSSKSRSTRTSSLCSSNSYSSFIPASSTDQELVNYDYHPHYGRPTHEWRNSNYLSGLRTNSTSQPFSYKADSSRLRR